MFPKFLIHCLVLPALISSALAAEEADPEKSAAKWITPAADKAIDRGLKWLADQQHEDGSFGSGPSRGNVAISGLSGMAFMSGGSTPNRGPYGAQVSRCVDYLLASAQPSGFINGPDTASHGPMYGHGFATMFLGECYGMSPNPELRDKLEKAVKLIVNCQNKDGGWRYFPIKEPADISVTVCEIMALRAARNAGVAVPKETIERSISYVKRSQNADGGFMYMLPSGDSGFPRSAGGVTALYSAGVYEGKELEKGLDYLMGFLPREGMTGYYFYGHYYAMQAMWQSGGNRFAKWYPAVRDDLLSKQHSDGAWSNPAESIDEYATAMACIILQIPNNYLPIFQR